MQTTKQLQRFYVVEVFRPQPLIAGSQGSETVSLPCGTSAFDRRQYTTRVNRARVEGTSPSTCARSRFPLPYPERDRRDRRGDAGSGARRRDDQRADAGCHEQADDEGAGGDDPLLSYTGRGVPADRVGVRREAGVRALKLQR